jgi:hypothetical protein
VEPRKEEEEEEEEEEEWGDKKSIHLVKRSHGRTKRKGEILTMRDE